MRTRALWEIVAHKKTNCANDNVRRLKTLKFITPNTKSSNIMNNNNIKSQQQQQQRQQYNAMSIPTIHQDLATRKVALAPSLSSTSSSSTTAPIDNQRTVLARHVFRADIKQTFIRWIRETPV